MTTLADAIDRRGYLLPLVGFAAVTVVFVCGPLLFFGTDRPPPQHFTAGALDWKDPRADARVAVRDRTARSIMEMANLFLLAASAYAAVSSAVNLTAAWPAIAGRRWQILVGAGGVLGLLYGPVNSNLNVFWVHSVPWELFTEACTRTGSGRLAVLSRVTQMTTQLTMVVLAADVAATLAVATTGPDVLGRQMGRVKQLLYHAAVVLVLYSVEAATEVLWPAALLTPDSKTVEDVKKLALGQALDVGVYNTLMLAFIFAPAVWVLTARVSRVVAEAGPGVLNEKERDDLLVKYDLAPTPAKFFTNLVSVLSPLLAGLPVVKVASFLLE